MEVHLSQFHQISYDDTNKTLTNNWLNRSELITKAQYKEEITIWFKLYNKFLPEYLFTNSHHFSFPISPDLQSWNSHFLKTLANHRLKKWAILISHDFFSQLSIEQTIQESSEAIDSLGYELQYFDNEVHAKNWLYAPVSDLT